MLHKLLSTDPNPWLLVVLALLAIPGVWAALARLQAVYRAWRMSRVSVLEHEGVQTGRASEFICAYYDLERVRAGGLELAVFELQTHEAKPPLVVTSVAEISPARFPLPLLDGALVRCFQTDSQPVADAASEDEIKAFITQLSETGTRVWNNPIWRLVSFGFDGDSLNLAFGVDTFYHYRYTARVRDELGGCLRKRTLDMESLLCSRRGLLPLRERYLPDADAVLRVRDRICAGGVSVTFAVAMPDGGFLIPLHIRSAEVAVAQGLRSVVPEGFHQPVNEDPRTVDLAYTIYREIYEELFQGAETEHDPEHPPRQVDPYAFMSISPEMAWLREHQDDCVVECTSFGLSCLTGNYEIGVLFAVMSEDLWRRHSAAMRANWESHLLTPIRTSDASEVEHQIRQPDWNDGALVSFIRGLVRLKELCPDRVNIPPIEYLGHRWR